MDRQLLAICLLTAGINLVGTLAYGARISVMTDDVVEERVSEPRFRRAIVWISLSRLAGTLLAQALFVPAATAIARIAGVF